MKPEHLLDGLQGLRVLCREHAQHDQGPEGKGQSQQRRLLRRELRQERKDQKGLNQDFQSLISKIVPNYLFLITGWNNLRTIISIGMLQRYGKNELSYRLNVTMAKTWI